MNYYEKNVNSFLSSVASNMSAVYLPAFFVSLIELLEDHYKFDSTPIGNHITVERTTVKISYSIATAYLLSYLLRIRSHIPKIKMAPTRGRTHDERFLGDELTVAQHNEYKPNKPPLYLLTFSQC